MRKDNLKFIISIIWVLDIFNVLAPGGIDMFDSTINLTPALWAFAIVIGII